MPRLKMEADDIEIIVCFPCHIFFSVPLLYKMVVGLYWSQPWWSVLHIALWIFPKLLNITAAPDVMLSSCWVSKTGDPGWASRCFMTWRCLRDRRNVWVRFRLQISAERSVITTGILRSFPQFLQKNVLTVPQARLSPLLIPTIQLYVTWSIESVVK
jgi:hypothetical protein